MNPPPAQPFASQLFLGPALRTQSDSRLVKLVREGYENAFEEIVRRYRKPLDRFAAGFVGSRSEDVTQDAFSKALLALRGSENEIELRPWLYRIVRNTALNEIRDRPPSVEQLEETLAGGASAAVEAERREEMGELMERLRALPEPQRAAIVMRELEGLSHDEIASALGVSGGAARQAIYRARVTLRNGLGMLVPLPLLRVLFEHGAAADAAGGAAAAAGAASAASAGGAGATLGGIGAGSTALKAGLATVLVAGSVGAAGVAIEHERSKGGPDRAEAALSGDSRRSAQSEPSGGSPGPGPGDGAELEPGDDRGGREAETGEGRGGNHGRGSDDRDGDDNSGRGSDSSGSGRGSGHGGEDDRSGPGGGGSVRSGGDDGSRSGSGEGSSGSSSGSGSSGAGESGSGDDDALVPPPPEESSSGSGSDGDGESSGSGSSGSGGGDN